MHTRLVTLASPLSTITRLSEAHTFGLKRLGIFTVADLLYHFPARYADVSQYTSINGLSDGATATIRGTITKLAAKKGWKSKIAMTEGVVEDVSGSMRVVWFNQPYLSKMLSIGQTVELTGKISTYQDKPALTNPVLREEKVLGIDSHDSLFASDTEGVFTPIYPETKGVSSVWISHMITRALGLLDTIPDHLPDDILKQFSLPGLKTSFIWIHSPRSKDDATIARKRFAYDEIFCINLARQKERMAIKKERAYAIDTESIDIPWFTKRFPFPLTGAQQRAVDAVLADLERDVPMSRLLEGDVGSGKTAVAAIATYATVMNRPFKKQLQDKKSATALASADKQTYGNLQVAYMAPTEILATQHFESFIEFFKESGISIALITGSGCRKFPTKVASSKTPWTTISRTQLQKWIANGEIPIVIGTHTLIQKSLSFKHLALAIIDEQHRFGLGQRKRLAKKDTHFPHLFSMTATPIPRTLALTIYGDLDLSILDEMPQGRKTIITEIVPPNKREGMYEKIRATLTEGRQLYVICPRINPPSPDDVSRAREPDLALLQMKNVTTEAARLQKDIFPEYRIGVLHSKMSKQEKEDTMQEFANHKLDILVATSVVEVGVNVPNATLIIIEGAERFGLSQLHQLRGRVQRSSYQSYCYLFADAKSDKTKDRMKLFTTAKNGFELAEYDLQLRGSGELTGVKQWGISDIGMDALRNLKLVEAARQSAITLITTDPSLAHYPLLAHKVAPLENMHFE